MQNLCYLKSAQFNNIVVNQTTQARDNLDQNKLIAGGFKFDNDGWQAHVDASYQSTSSKDELIITDVGQRLPSVTLDTGDDGVAHFTIPGDGLLSTDNLYIRNSFQQNFSLTKGSIFALRADGSKEIGGLLQQIKFGARYARRTANSNSVVLNTPTPGGNIGTATEASAVKVSDTGLPAGFLSIGSKAPDINGGQAFYAPDPDFLLSNAGQDALRQYFGLATGTPAFQKSREFDAFEHTISAYGEADYLIPISSSVSIDGVVGGRFIQTERGIITFTAQGSGFTPVGAKTTDRDFLPSATARLKLNNGLQARLSYDRTIRRPDFSDLNPAVTLSLSNNPFVQSSGTAGNPDLREQKSDNFDGTIEYYFHGGYLSAAGFYRRIKDRVITGAANETIDGIDYSVTRPRNIGKADVKGVELSGQYFLDFLPGAFSGLGVQGAFTLADSKIGGGDTLAGYPLAGVSKYNFTAGLLYEKYGVSGRLVYTYRSRYITSDQTGSISVRPIDSAQAGDVFVPTLVSYVHPAGRLDFSVGYDINKSIRVDVGGTNVLRTMTRDYLGKSFETFEAFYDETTYTVGVRIKI